MPTADSTLHTVPDRPAWGWIALTVLVCAFIGVLPQAHAFEVVGVPDAVTTALRWQAAAAVGWGLTAAPLARRWSLTEREGRALVGLLLLSLGVSIAAAWLGTLLLEASDLYSRNTVLVEFTYGAWPTHALTATMLSLVGSWTNARLLRARATDRETTLRAHATRAELDALRERMQPHFVLNALNTVAALARRGDTDAAGEVATDLGELLQFAMGTADDVVSFDTERTIVERYLAIEQARFGDRLQVVWQLAPDVRTTRLPSLAWQPLVENAVRHDLASRAAGGTLTLAATRDQTHLHITVDTRRHQPAGAPPPLVETAPFGGLGLGTSTLERRLTLLYGQGAHFTRTVRDDGATASLRIPLSPVDEASAPFRTDPDSPLA